MQLLLKPQVKIFLFDKKKKKKSHHIHVTFLSIYYRENQLTVKLITNYKIANWDKLHMIALQFG